ncbi:methyl viologen resistance protein SmvA [Thermoplasmatales archaeon]|nr:methyl viologen resistance protein SmvA [Thermoplasmatales archaeon]
MTESQPSDYRSMSEYDSKYATRVMLILAGLVLIVMYIEGMLTPSLPTIAHDFNVTSAQVSLLLSAYLVGGVAMTPVVGKLGDIYGKKKMLTIVLVVYAVAVSVTGFSPNFTFMVVSRTIQGIGLTIMPLGMSLAREEFPKEIVPRAQAIISAMFGAGFAISLPLGSFVSNDYGWRMTYHTAIPFVIALVIVTIIVIKESRFRRPGAKIDYYGAAMLGSSLAFFVFALSEAPSWGWYSFNTFFLLTAGFILLFPLTIYELRYSRRVGEAILNFKLLAERNVMVANVVLTISGMGMFLAMQALTYRFDLPEPSGFGRDILETGIALVPFALGMLVLAPITGAYVSRVGVKPFAILGSVLSAVGFLLEAVSQSFTQMLVFEFITGAGLAMLNASLINLIVLTVNPKDMGLATAMNGTFRSVGSSVGAPVAGSIMSTITASYIVGNSTVIMPAHLAYSDIFLIAAVSFMIGAIMTLLAREVLGKKRYMAKTTHTETLKEKSLVES